jgi:hypothetical protein
VQTSSVFTAHLPDGWALMQNHPARLPGNSAPR